MRNSMVRVLSLGLLVALVVGNASALAAGADHVGPIPMKAKAGGFSHVSPRGTTSLTSNTLAGYAVMTTAGTVTDVKATWNVPQLAAKCPSTQHKASFSVGIDGINTSTYERIGTETDCWGGTTSYYAWYDFNPASAVILGMTISPTNTMHAEIKYSSTTHKITLSISDAKTGKSFSISKAVSKAVRSSAEWLVENTDLGFSFPLTDFGWVVFNNASATISGATHSIGGFNNDKFTMWNLANTAKMAIPLSLANGGATFRVNWNSSGP